MVKAIYGKSMSDAYISLNAALQLLLPSAVQNKIEARELSFTCLVT
jgi:hypothetical protein